MTRPLMLPTTPGQIGVTKGRVLELERRLGEPDGPFPVVYSFVASGRPMVGASGRVNPLDGCRLSGVVIRSAAAVSADLSVAVRRGASTLGTATLVSGDSVAVAVFDLAYVGPEDYVDVEVTSGGAGDNVVVTVRGESTIRPDFQAAALGSYTIGRVHFDMGPGLVSQITSAPYRAVGAETYTSFEATLNTAPSTGDVDVAVKKNGSTQTTITIANAATEKDHPYTLTLADGDVVTMEVTDGNGSGAEGLHIVMVP